MSDLENSGEPVLAFPCDFPLKVMGRKQPGFTKSVVELVRRHCPDFDDTTLQTRLSREGTYLSLTFDIQATSQAHLDALYRDLCDHPMVAMVL
jgi:putative lipoic acid-binding regulatory protein